MLEQALEWLANTGGTAVVGAMATTAWQTASKGVTKLFARTDSERRAAIQAQLDGNPALIERAADQDRARAALVGLWQMELARLLEDHPEVEPDLRALISQIRGELPAEHQVWVQTNIARDQSTLFAAQGGNVIVHQTPPSPSPRPAPAPD